MQIFFILGVRNIKSVFGDVSYSRVLHMTKLAQMVSCPLKTIGANIRSSSKRVLEVG